MRRKPSASHCVKKPPPLVYRPDSSVFLTRARRCCAWVLQQCLEAGCRGRAGCRSTSTCAVLRGGRTRSARMRRRPARACRGSPRTPRSAGASPGWRHFEKDRGSGLPGPSSPPTTLRSAAPGWRRWSWPAVPGRRSARTRADREKPATSRGRTSRGSPCDALPGLTGAPGWLHAWRRCVRSAAHQLSMSMPRPWGARTRTAMVAHRSIIVPSMSKTRARTARSARLQTPCFRLAR